MIYSHKEAKCEKWDCKGRLKQDPFKDTVLCSQKRNHSFEIRFKVSWNRKENKKAVQMFVLFKGGIKWESSIFLKMNQSTNRHSNCLHQGGYVFLIGLFACLSAGLTENYWSDFHETWLKGVVRAKEEPLNFGASQNHWYRNYFPLTLMWDQL